MAPQNPNIPGTLGEFHGYAGVEVGHVVQLRDGRFVHVQAFIGWDRALAAAGVASSAD